MTAKKAAAEGGITDSGIADLGAPAVIVKGDLVAMNTIVGVHGKASVLNKGDEFSCSNPEERARLLRLGAAREIAEVKATEEEAVKTIKPE